MDNKTEDSNFSFLFDPDTLFLIAGPCVVEGASELKEVAEGIASVCNKLNIPFVFKASYRKANRSSLNSFTGVGDKKALRLLAEMGAFYNVPVITDIHSAEEAEFASKYVDLLQIPAFLCRQTDLLLAAGRTGKPVSIKKGQFMSPASMLFAVDKVRSTGNDQVLLTERGTFFGYSDLVVDFRGLKKMQEFNVPVIMDCTHSLQQPNQSKGITGGNPEYIETMAKAAVVTGVNGLFIETHPQPENAKSDGANMLALKELEPLLKKVLRIHQAL